MCLMNDLTKFTATIVIGGNKETLNAPECNCIIFYEQMALFKKCHELIPK